MSPKSPRYTSTRVMLSSPDHKYGSTRRRGKVKKSVDYEQKFMSELDFMKTGAPPPRAPQRRKAASPGVKAVEEEDPQLLAGGTGTVDNWQQNCGFHHTPITNM